MAKKLIILICCSLINCFLCKASEHVENIESISPRHHIVLDNQARIIGDLYQNFIYGSDHFRIEITGKEPIIIYFSEINKKFPLEVIKFINYASLRSISTIRAKRILVKTLVQFIKQNKQEVIEKCQETLYSSHEDLEKGPVVSPCTCGVQLHERCFHDCQTYGLKSCPNSFCTTPSVWDTSELFESDLKVRKISKNKIYPKASCPICQESLSEDKKEALDQAVITKKKASRPDRFSCIKRVAFSCLSSKNRGIISYKDQRFPL